MKQGLKVKVRSTGKLLECVYDGKNEIILKKGEEGVSAGQACVFYRDDELGTRVLGGGWIAKTEN